jgi:hypothetical protein
MVSLRDLSALSASAVISLAGNSNIFMHLGAPPAHERLTGNEPGIALNLIWVVAAPLQDHRL